MAKLYFKVASDWEEVVRLRNEIAKLKQELMSMDCTQSPAAFKTLNTQLATSNQRLDELVTNAAKAGAEMETGFKRKIFDASQSVNDLSEKITFQRGTIQQLKNELSSLKDKYREALKQDGDTSSLVTKIKSTSEKLREQKGVLFNLTQEQANARLSVKKLRDEYELYKNDGKQVVETNEDIAISWKKALAVIGGFGALKALGSEMIRVRGEFQAADTAIQTLLGSKEKADALMAQVREYAKISSLEFSDVTSATQMMLGFNIEAEKVPKFISAIGDVSMGESGKFNSLTLAFSQMSAAGKLMGQDLNQMINAGFNPLQIISEKTGKSIATLKDEMSKGAISAEMVQQAFIDATSAGGKFYNMSENASKTINGQLSMMQDAIDSVFNELGKKSEGVIMDGIQMTTSLIQNYETVGKVLAGLVVTYGVYRTAAMLVTAAESKHTLVEIGLTNARLLARKAQLALNAAMLTNPYVLLATAIVGLGAAMWAFHDATTTQEKEQKRINDRTSTYNKYLQDEKEHIEQLFSVLQDETKAKREKIAAFDELKAKYPSVFSKYETEKQLIDNITEARKAENEQIRIRQELMTVKNNRDDVSRLAELKELLKLQTVGESGRRRQGLQGRWKSLYEKYNVRTGKNYFQSDTSYIKEMIAETASTINAGQNAIRKQERDAWEEHVLTLDKASAEEHKKMLEGYMAILKKSNKEWILIEGENAPVNAKMLQERISALNDKFLNVEMKDAAKFREEAKKAWEKASEEVEAVKNGKRTYKTPEEYENALEEARNKEKAAKKTYEDRGGITGSSLTKQENQAEKLRKEQERYNAILDEQALERKRLVEDLQNQVDEAYIKAKNEGSKKVIAEMELNYEKEMQAIDRQKEDALRKKVDDARTAFEADPKNKNKVFNSSGIVLSDKENKLFDEKYKAAIAIWEKNLSDYNQSSKKSWNEYLKEFGNYQQKRQAILDLAMQEAEKASTPGERESILKKAQNEVDELDNSIRNSTTLMGQLFADASQKSASEIQRIIEKAELLMRYLEAVKDEKGNAFIGGKKVSKQDILNIGISDNTLQNLMLSTEQIESLRNAINKLKGDLGNKSPFELLKTQIKDAREKIKQGGKDNIAQGISEIGGAIMQFSPTVSQFGKDLGNIVGDDDLGSKIAGVSEAIGGLGQTAMGVGQIMSGDIVGGAMSAVQGISQVVSALDGLFGADYSSYEAMKERYNNLSAIWDELIDKKTKYIDISYGKEALNAGQEVLDIIKKSQDAQRNLAGALASSGSSAGSHSIAARQNRDLGGYASELYKYVSQNGNYNDITNALLGASAEQLQKVRDQMQEFWAGLDSDFQGHLNNIIKGEEQAEEVLEQMKKAVTGMGFDEFRNGYASLLADLSSSNKDFADNFEKQLQKSIFESLIANKYKDRIQELYDAWIDYGQDGMTSDEAKRLRDMQQQLSDSLLAERNKLMQDFGWQSETTSQSSTKGYSIAASQDSVDEVSGRLTALQIAEEEIKNQAIQQTDLLSSINEKISLLNLTNEDIPRLTANTPDIAGQTREILASSYQPQITINFPTDKIESLASDVSSLKGIVDELRTNQIEKFNDVVEGVSKMAKNTPVMNEKIDSINDNIKKAL